MNLNHLKYFYDAAKFNSISQAAKNNFVGQPAISRGIAALEEHLKTKLIIHRKNNFRPTKDGELVLEKCNPIFTAVRDLEENTFNNPLTPCGTFSFACSQSFAACFFPIFTKKLKEKCPALSPLIRIGNGESILDWLKNDRVDFGIVLEDDDKDSFTKKKLIEGNFYLVCSKKLFPHWKEEGILISEERPETAKLRKQLAERLETKTTIKMRIASWGVIKQLVYENVGAGLLPDYLIDKELSSGVFVNCLPEASNPYKLSILTHKQNRLTRNAEIALELLNGVIKEIHPSTIY